MKTFQGIAGLAGAAGTDLGASDWLEIDQQRIDTFAAATGDHQWIHVDPERAADGPFGATIAHGFLTLSVLPVLQHQLYAVEDVRMAVNVGLNKVRFPHPVRVGSRIRDHVTMGEVTDLPAGKQLTLRHTIEIEGQAKPACVAETVVLLLP